MWIYFSSHHQSTFHFNVSRKKIIHNQSANSQSTHDPLFLCLFIIYNYTLVFEAEDIYTYYTTMGQVKISTKKITDQCDGHLRIPYYAAALRFIGMTHQNCRRPLAHNLSIIFIHPYYSQQDVVNYIMNKFDESLYYWWAVRMFQRYAKS